MRSTKNRATLAKYCVWSSSPLSHAVGSTMKNENNDDVVENEDDRIHRDDRRRHVTAYDASDDDDDDWDDKEGIDHVCYRLIRVRPRPV